MSWVDIIITAVVFIGIWRGFSAGLIKSFASLISWLLALVVASKTAADWAPLFAPLVDGIVLQTALAFIVIMLCAVVVVGLLAGLITRSLKALKLGFVDRIAGAVLGAATGVLKVLIVLSVATPLLALAPQAQSSVLIPSLLPYAPMAKTLLQKAFDTTWNQLENPYQ